MLGGSDPWFVISGEKDNWQRLMACRSINETQSEPVWKYSGHSSDAKMLMHVPFQELCTAFSPLPAVPDFTSAAYWWDAGVAGRGAATASCHAWSQPCLLHNHSQSLYNHCAAAAAHAWGGGNPAAKPSPSTQTHIHIYINTHQLTMLCHIQVMLRNQKAREARDSLIGWVINGCVVLLISQPPANDAGGSSVHMSWHVRKNPSIRLIATLNI